jgi:uncharacterized protein
VTLNGAAIPARPDRGWIAIQRRWQAGDTLVVALPMRLTFEPAPDQPTVQAVTYGPVVLSGVYPSDPGALTQDLEPGSVQQTATAPMAFAALSRGKPVTLIPVSRAAHEHYTVYWQTSGQADPAPGQRL